MARRLYLTNSAAPVFNPGSTLKGTWSDTTNAGNSGGLLRSPTGGSASALLSETSASTTFDAILAHWTSHPIPRSFTLSGSINWVIAVNEDLAGADMFTKCHIWVSQGASTTLRGTLLDNFIGSSEWSTTAQGTADGAVPLTAVDVKEGDFITIEFGYRATNSSTSPFTGTMSFGTTGTPDLVVGDTGTTLRPSWVEFNPDPWGPSELPNPGTRPRPFAPGFAR